MHKSLRKITTQVLIILLFTAGLATILFTVPVSATTYTLYDSCSEENQDYELWLEDPHPSESWQSAVGQSFNTTESEVDMGIATFYLNKTGSPTGTLKAAIYAHTGTFGESSEPTGDAFGTSDGVDISTLTTSYALYNFTFSTPVTLNASTYYVLVVYVDSGSLTPSSDYVSAGADEAGGSHEGNAPVWTGGSWYTLDQDDLIFYLYSVESDSTSPTYSGLSSSSTVANASCNFNVTVTDETDLSHWIFGTNNTGTWTNETATAFSTNPESIGETKTLNSTVGVNVGYQFYFNDTSDNWNSTTLTYITTTDGDVPTFSAITSNTTIANAGVELNVTISDNAAVSHFIYSWNNTGTWVNQTTTAFSSNPCQLSGTFNSTVGLVISVKVYANDTSDNWGTSSQYNFTLTGYNLTLQARDASGTNLPRTVTFTVTFPNSTETDFTSSTSGAKSITTCYGTHNVTVKWGDHLVKSSTSVSVTGDTTSNLDTKIQRLDYGTDYVLISLNNTDLVTPTLDGENNIHFHNVAASGEIEIKIDIANWKTTLEPSWFEAGTSSYGVGDGTWSFSDNVFTLTSDYDGVQDVFLVFVVEAGGGGAGGGGGGEPPSTGPEEGGEVPEEEPSEEPTEPIITPPKDLGDLTPELAVFLIGAIVVGVALLAETKKGKGKFKVLKAKNKKFKKI